MTINKTNSSYVTGQIIDYVDRVDAKPSDEKFKKCFDLPINIFTSEVEFDTISIGCLAEDVDFLLYDYIKTLSQSNHLAVFSFVDAGIPVEIVNKIKRLRELSEYCKVTPTGLHDDKIQIHIGFFTNACGEQYDVDLLAKTLFD